MTDNDRSNFWPTATLETLQLRSKILQQVRQFFLDREYIEVDTPILSRDTVVDSYIDPIAVGIEPLPNCPAHFWLQTSPEFAMKRLLTAGLTSIFQITRAFRNGERGDYHNPEFTIVEWYQVGQSYSAGRELLGELCSTILERKPIREISYAAAFRKYAQIDPFDCSIDDLRRSAADRSIAPPPMMNQDDRDAWLNLIMAFCVENRLGVDAPTILFDYPASQAALAQIDESNPQVAQRFELYVDEIELANGYYELLDANELRRRNDLNNRKRKADQRKTLPTESFLMSAMQHGLPKCTGVALGFDRLVMLAARAQSIDSVLPFPIERA